MGWRLCFSGQGKLGVPGLPCCFGAQGLMRGLGRALGQVLPGPTPLGRAVPGAGACVIIFPFCSVQLVGCTWFALFWSWYS